MADYLKQRGLIYMHSVSTPGYHKVVDEIERQLLTDKINAVKN